MAGEAEVKKAMAKGYAEKREFNGLEYIRFRAPYKNIERGSVIIRGEFFPGFPHIKRIFTLEKGLERNLEAKTVYAEEKIDGYNARAILFAGKIYGLSRGGIIDAFSTEKFREIVPKKALESGVMLCGEMIGNTPYTKPTNEYDVKYLVFEIYGLGEGEYYPPEERYSFLSKHGLDSVPRLGKFDIGTPEGMKRLGETALNLNKAKKEGMAIKAPGEDTIKYVNPNADIEDISGSIKALFDMPTGHFNQRMLRSAMFIRDFKLDVKKYGEMMGRSAYESLINGMKMLEKDGCIYDEFEILVREPSVFDELRAHMSKDVRLEVLFKKEEGEKQRIRFRKVYLKSTKKLKEFLNGKGITD